MYAGAALIIEQVSGESYADFIREHIFVPTGMTESLIDSTYLTPSDDVATAYIPQEDGRLMPIPPLAWKKNMGAAGLYSTVETMSNGVVLHLASDHVTVLSTT